MVLRRLPITVVYVVVSLGAFVSANRSFSFTRSALKSRKDEVQKLIEFGIDSYLNFGYPYDEVRPISCVPNTRNYEDPDDLVKNDVLGNFTTTLIDSLSTVAVIGDRTRFHYMVNLLRETYLPNNMTFEIDSTVQVFETTIRIVGGLISAHLYATDSRKKVWLGDDYTDSFLLLMAKDMADRLLPAYLTETGLPVPRINLKKGIHGIPWEQITENNIAGMASPMLEFTLLSYLTGDDKYAQVTRYAFDKIWSMRSNLDLLPWSINPIDKTCYVTTTGIGASIDSFYEYALKGSVLFDDPQLYQIWHQSSNALRINSRSDWFYTNVNTATGYTNIEWIDSLSAFFPGLEVLSGDLDDARDKHLMFMKLWNNYGGIPERWTFQSGISGLTMGPEMCLPLEWYPLRPEFIESTYFLYRATKDPFYLNIGYKILHDFQTRFKQRCGFSGLQNIATGEMQDRMETFVIGETLKYLYLLFDEDNELHSTRDNAIFSTEAHPVWLTNEVKRNYREKHYFNDSLYLTHLEKCKSGERNDITRGNRNTENSLELVFRKEDPTLLRVVPTIGNCPNTVTHRDRGMSLPHSKLLSSYNRLFEIDHRYNDTLISPWYLQNEIAMELDPQFYEMWHDPRSSVSKPYPTTQSFDLIFDYEGPYVSPQRSVDGSIYHFTSFQGRRKFRLERLEVDKIDHYGGTRSALRYLETADTVDLHSGRCGNYAASLSPPFVYRVTVVDGFNVPPNGKAVLKRKDVLDRYSENQNNDPFPQNSDPQRMLGLGYNKKGQLLLNCIPLVNVYIQ
ncbi:alpha-1,2-mannosidase MNL1 KNAG_0M00200 [Huiozyma naganishii CBS 8797]|uniref:alpha-1,2-Mannosidase n=1 Tax=Huiozyma naganishii (strain ATCC MYA-139 / BCRC 22969 / CBS 8797 / KCTC 17520 / NBRC 10181 / NCYC 3082 / Yp74L-3) TaxID=1071383 RepID=J7RSH6_HUIN7|nr:hypothetical protein KNAG_0M00200 [Kazachstania naganishii CBS 8797]CCK72873.1 hypothetical protein KNAG_0M00200 [Kazachstania naganishii CBS 8797]